jgi:hypothetical protein
VSGVQVSPKEIEDVLFANPEGLISDVSVAGVSGGRTSDEKVPRAWIVLSSAGKKKGAPAVIKALEAWHQESLSKYKWLRGGIEVVKEVCILALLLAARLMRRRFRKHRRGRQCAECCRSSMRRARRRARPRPSCDGPSPSCLHACLTGVFMRGSHLYFTEIVFDNIEARNDRMELDRYSQTERREEAAEMGQESPSVFGACVPSYGTLASRRGSWTYVGGGGVRDPSVVAGTTGLVCAVLPKPSPTPEGRPDWR